MKYLPRAPLRMLPDRFRLYFRAYGSTNFVADHITSEFFFFFFLDALST